MSHSHQKKRRAIVVEGVTYHWKFAPPYRVYIWDPDHARQQFDFANADYYDVSPRRVADHIYRLFLHREPPPRPVIRVRVPSPEPVMIPQRASQADIYNLVRTSYYYHWDGRGDLIARAEVIAAFTDPAMAKLQAQRLNPPYVSALQALARGKLAQVQYYGTWLAKPEWQPKTSLKDRFLALLDPADRPPIDSDWFERAMDGFELYSAVAVPLYDAALAVDRQWQAA
jgi:hypothetical protein